MVRAEINKDGSIRFCVPTIISKGERRVLESRQLTFIDVVSSYNAPDDKRMHRVTIELYAEENTPTN